MGENVVVRGETGSGSELKRHDENVVAAGRNGWLSPETGKELSRLGLIRFIAGFFAYGVVWGVGIGIVVSVLLPLRCKQVVGISPETALGMASASGSFAATVSNLLFGVFSDRSRSRFGRRTPFVLAGGVFGGLALYLMGTTTSPALLAFYYAMSMVGLNCMQAPMVAAISDRIPSALRGTVSAFYAIGPTVGTSFGSIVGSKLVDRPLQGFLIAGVFMSLGGVVAVLLLPREGSAAYLPRPTGGGRQLVQAFMPPAFLQSRDFYRAFLAHWLMTTGCQLISSYQMYILEDYIGLDVRSAVHTISVVAMINLGTSLLGSVCAGPISDFIRGRRLLVVLSSCCVAAGLAMPWMFRSVAGIYLNACLGGVGNGVYSGVNQALFVDVLPDQSTAGKDLGFLNFSTTLGQMAGALCMPLVVDAFGYGAGFPIAIVIVLFSSVFVLRITNSR